MERIPPRVTCKYLEVDKHIRSLQFASLVIYVYHKKRLSGPNLVFNLRFVLVLLFFVSSSLSSFCPKFGFTSV